MSGKMYERWLDATQAIDEDFDLEAWTLEQHDRLLDVALMAQMVVNSKRRLGADAEPQLLARDKRFAKKLRNQVLGIVEGQWRDPTVRKTFKELDGNPVGPRFDRLRIEAAQVVWAEWMQANTAELRTHATYIATQLHHRMQGKLANKMVHRFEIEIGLLNQLFDRVLNENSPHYRN